MKLPMRPAYAAHVPIRLAVYSCLPAKEKAGFVDPSDEYTVVAIYEDKEQGRARFNQMIEDAQKDRFDYVFTETIRSFGSSMEAALLTVQALKARRIGVIFSSEKIDTLSEEGQKLLDVIAAFDEKKHRVHSEAIHQAIRKNFESGKPQINLNRMLGYDLDEDGRTWVVNEEQAETVRYIFHSYAAGLSANQIAGDLNKSGVGTINGSIWRADSIMGVLRNEKYVGDVEMQKTISAASYTPVVNAGQAPKYYRTNHHAAIIERDLWDRVQAMIRGFGNLGARSKTKKPGTVFGRLTCGSCGGSYKRYGYSMTIERYSDERSLAAEGMIGAAAAGFSEQYAISYSVWRCENKYIGHEGKHGRLSQSELASSEGCRESHILHETALEQSFMEMLYRMKTEYQEKGEDSSFSCEFRKACRNTYESLGGTGALLLQIDALDDRIRTLTGQLETARAKMLESSLTPEITPAEKQTAMQKPETIPAEKQTDMQKPGITPAEKRNAVQKPENTSAVNQQAVQENASVETSAAVVYAKLLGDISRKIAECEEEKKKRTEEVTLTLTMKQNYDFFIRCLMALPDKNRAGERLNVNGIHVKGSLFADYDGKGKEDMRRKYLEGAIRPEAYLADAPDFLPFDKSLFLTFFPRGVVKKDMIEYTTSFGVSVECTGCGRNLSSFLGFRKVSGTGKPEMITEVWQVNGRQIQYRRKEKGRKTL